MMRSTILYIIGLILVATGWLPVAAYTQGKADTAKIATISRYKDQRIELRWIPDNKTILRLGFANSYTVQRRTGNEAFRDMTTVTPLAAGSWDQLIAAEKDTAVLHTLETAREFLFAKSLADEKGLGLENGTAALREQKAKEDMVYALFVLSVMKSGRTAEALGLSYIDAAVTPGAVYTYRIRLNASSQVYQVQNGEAEMKAVAETNRILTEVSVYPGDSSLSFTWPANSRLNGYWVERSVGDTSRFIPLNTVPFYHASASGADVVNGSFDDDSLRNYTWYHYRFYGMNAFGERIRFAEVKGMPRDLTPPPAPIVKQPRHIKPREVLVEWQPAGNITELKGFIVARSDRDSGNFNMLHKILLPARTTSFTDTGFNTETDNYYTVYAIDTAGNISASYPAYVALIDSIPPGKPAVISATVDSLGIVRIVLAAGKEKDLKGYRLFKTNSADHELSVIEEVFRENKTDTQAVRSVFTDTIPLNSLTANVYYRVKALDFNYNQSPFSEMIVLARPDTIPPVDPVFTDILVNEKKIELFFAGSGSADLESHILYRKSDLSDAWDSLALIPRDVRQYSDTAVKSGRSYYYSLRAKDKGGLFSGFASPVHGKPYPDDRLPGVTGLRSGVQEKKIVLQWQYEKQEKEVVFMIYKKDRNAHLVQYARVNTTAFTDPKPDRENTYAIKVLSADGSQSPLSNLITQRNE